MIGRNTELPEDTVKNLVLRALCLKPILAVLTQSKGSLAVENDTVIIDGPEELLESFVKPLTKTLEGSFQVLTKITIE